MKKPIPFSSLCRKRYILNLDSGIVHRRNCHYVDRMTEKNRFQCNGLEEAQAIAIENGKANLEVRFCKVCMRDEEHLDWAA